VINVVERKKTKVGWGMSACREKNGLSDVCGGIGMFPNPGLSDICGGGGMFPNHGLSDGCGLDDDGGAEAATSR